MECEAREIFVGAGEGREEAQKVPVLSVFTDMMPPYCDVTYH